jgi:UDP-N-acetylmuramoyl-tripeptide--D-alanyl-D-alanine ligase
MSSPVWRPPLPRRPLADLIDDLAPEAELRVRDETAGSFSSLAVSRVEPDLRRLAAGDLFVALPGESVDGHDLVAMAAVRGAAAALVTRSWAERLTALPLPLLVVEDPQAAVLRLAASWRRHLGATVVGVTGSVGKTSTKEAIAACLRPVRRTWATEANRNTTLGVALTLLDAHDGDEIVVVEIGGGGHHREVAEAAALARPDLAVVTSVHPVHLQTMGTLAAIADSKADLVRAISPAGAVVLNADDPLVQAMADLSAAPVRRYGRGSGADVAAERVVARGLAGTDLVVRVGERRHPVSVPFLGGHAVEVVLAAAAVVDALGEDLDQVLPHLADASGVLRPRLVPGIVGSRVIDDAYSASPPAMISALDLLGSLDRHRRIAVLGDMKELGGLTVSEHQRIGRHAADRVDRLVTVGEAARGLAAAASAQRPDLPVTALGEDELNHVVALVAGDLDERSAVLVKGSRAMRLERVVEALRR